MGTVYTAQYSTRDPDRLDVTRMGTWIARKKGDHKTRPRRRWSAWVRRHAGDAR